MVYLWCGLGVTLPERVVARYQKQAFKYEPKESKKTRVEKLMRAIYDAIGVSKGVAEDIADAFIRHRDLAALALQKGWGIEVDGTKLDGPRGTLDLATV